MSLRFGDLPAHAYGEAVGVLARGMRDNPIHVAAYGHDPQRRERCHGRLVGALLRPGSANRPIGAWDGDRLVACTGVAVGGACRPGARERARLLPALLSLGPPTAARVLRWASAWAAADPDEPHAHLGPLAVDRDLQARGIGSQLLDEHCRRLDAAGLTGYLETDREANVRFYERGGYVTVASDDVLGVRCWYMRRPPQATAAGARSRL